MIVQNLTLLFLPVLLAAQTWILQPPSTRPSARHRAGMAYDAARAEFVLFGGETSGVLWDNGGT